MGFALKSRQAFIAPEEFGKIRAEAEKIFDSGREKLSDQTPAKHIQCGLSRELLESGSIDRE
jgi:hypothetical protein